MATTARKVHDKKDHASATVARKGNDSMVTMARKDQDNHIATKSMADDNAVEENVASEAASSSSSNGLYHDTNYSPT